MASLSSRQQDALGRRCAHVMHLPLHRVHVRQGAFRVHGHVSLWLVVQGSLATCPADGVREALDTLSRYSAGHGILSHTDQIISPPPTSLFDAHPA